jgi:hypothetical protein
MPAVGPHIGRRKHSVQIDRFDGERSIMDLPVYPERFDLMQEDKRANRIARGQKYLDLIRHGFAYQNYNGFLSRNATNPNLKQDHRQVCSHWGDRRDSY